MPGLAWSPDGRLLARTDNSTTVRVYEVATGRQVMAVGGKRGRLRCVAFSPAGTLAEADVPTVERAATVAALAVTKQLAVHAVESKYRGDFLRELLGGRVGTEVGVAHAASLGWDVDRPLVVVVAELDPVDGDDEGGPEVVRVLHQLAGATEGPHHLVVAAAWLEVGGHVVPVDGVHRVLLEAPDPVVAHHRDHRNW